MDEGLNANQCKEYEDRFGKDQVRQLYPECDKFEEEFGRFKGKFDSYNNMASLNYSRDVADQFNISAGYSYRRYWSPEEGTRDSNGNSLRLRIDYGYSPITIFSLSYYFDENRYDEGDAISRQSVDIGVRRYITKVLYLSGRFGRDYYSSSDNTEIEVSVTGQIDEKTT
ncbi:MAG: hypothetical protein HZC49_06945, partial [Nitrospirae bacterium]|nr:hypothetical protein [Nitrospirota bacterium]